MDRPKGKELIKDIYNRRNKETGFWLGNPAVNAKKIYCNYFGIENLNSEKYAKREDMILTADEFDQSDIELALKLKSDVIFLPAEPGAWKAPDGRGMWNITKDSSQSPLGILADCEDAKELEDYNWPDPKYLDFSDTKKMVEEADDHGLAVFGGMWGTFFHVACDLFGMEEYFIKMHTHPEVVLEVTDRVVNFYLEANKRCFELMGDRLSSAFFGNDLGSQLGLLISLPFYEKFVEPFMKRMVIQMKSYNLKTTMHCCGAIFELIPSFIHMGIDALHPLQAKAAKMGPERLVEEFGRDIIFIGGVDTQELLPFGTPTQVRDEVRRLKEIFHENFIVSPSHEALLENVPIENVIAMSEAAKE